MPKRIEEDRKDFRDVYGGKIRKALQKFINNGTIFRHKPNGKGYILVTLPRLDIPHAIHGDNDKGVGQGQGKNGDIIKKGNKDGKGKGNGQGEGQEGITIEIDMEEVLQFMQDDLKLPDLKPKPNETFEDEVIKYNDISKVGPESLRHNRRTMLQALKRMSSTGEIDKLHNIPGFDIPIKLISPINSDRRYRQYKIIKKPSSNAVMFFARDGSASMDQAKCDIVSNMCWWMDVWIRRFYKRVESCYIWHDVTAQEVSQDKFYRYRYGGGTKCSSAMDLIAEQFTNRFPPNKWNIYVFYFTDGENQEPNADFIKVLREKFPANAVNLVAVTQVLAPYEMSLKQSLDTWIDSSPPGSNVKTAAIGHTSAASAEEIDQQTRQAIIDLLGKKPTISK
jgi:uncharacterized sporulation protein YeaH/YhbH (DUF444 family)